MEENNLDFWKGKANLLKFHREIKLEVARMRLEFERIKQMTDKEDDDYQKLGKLGLEMWNSLYEELNKTTDETKKIELIQEMNKIREAVEQLNQSRQSLEEIVHTMFKN